MLIDSIATAAIATRFRRFAYAFDFATLRRRAAFAAAPPLSFRHAFSCCFSFVYVLPF
jgi:hypothetical protein